MNAGRNPRIEPGSGNVNLDLERLNAGALGKLFGAGPSAASNIAGFIAGVALIGGLAINLVLLGSQKESPYEIWKYLAPIVTGCVGFIFGKRQ